MSVPRRVATAVAALILAAGCAATLLAQATDAGAGSLAALTTEIRQLRLAIEQSSRTQTQAQALGIFLTAQQSRILQATARLDAARKELEVIAQRSDSLGNQLAQFEEDLPTLSDANERRAFEGRAREIKLEMKRIAAQEQQARTREAEMVQAWQQEEARWNDLIGRLQQIVER